MELKNLNWANRLWDRAYERLNIYRKILEQPADELVHANISLWSSNDVTVKVPYTLIRETVLKEILDLIPKIRSAGVVIERSGAFEDDDENLMPGLEPLFTEATDGNS